MTLHDGCYLLGLPGLLLGVWMLAVPSRARDGLRAFPRHALAGYILSAAAWIWAGWALWTMDLDLINPYKTYLPVLVLICIPLTWFWMDNLLACRATGALLTLFPYELLHLARVHASPWRLVVVSFIYLCIVMGMTLLLYPWKMRQCLEWLAQSTLKIRLAGGFGVLLGLLFIALGLTVLR